jgi:antitoxin YefM
MLDMYAKLYVSMFDFAVTTTELRENLALTLDRITDENSVALIKRRDRPDIVMLPAAEFSSIVESLYLMQSPANARRLLDAMARMDAGEGSEMTLQELQQAIQADLKAEQAGCA